jgi:hypothetical protein
MIRISTLKAQIVTFCLVLVRPIYYLRLRTEISFTFIRARTQKKFVIRRRIFAG